VEVHRQFLEACADAAELFEPTDALFGDAAASIRALVEPHRRIVTRRLIVLVRDDRLDVLLGQPVADALHAVGFVAGELAWFAAAAELLAAADQRRERLADDRLGARRFMDLPGGDLDRKGSARTVSDHVEFGAKPAS